MEIPFETVAVIANLVTAARLILYRRGGSQFKRGMSVIAWALIVLTGGYAIDVVFNATPVSPYGSGLSVVLMILVLRAHGNVSKVVRCAT